MKMYSSLPILVLLSLFIHLQWWYCFASNNSIPIDKDTINKSINVIKMKQNNLLAMIIEDSSTMDSINDSSTMESIDSMDDLDDEKIIPERWSQIINWKYLLSHCLMIIMIILVTIIFFTIYTVIVFHYIRLKKIDYHVIIPLNDF